MRQSFIIVLLTVGLFTSEVQAQNILKNSIYRIIAFKRGNHAVTSQSNYKELVPPLKMYIPNAFTPNGDGLNDQFGVKGEGIGDFRMLVYDRWGEVIFESDRPEKQWDGNYKGQPVQQGTYVYQVYTKGTDKRSRTGSVTLIR